MSAADCGQQARGALSADLPVVELNGQEYAHVDRGTATRSVRTQCDGVLLLILMARNREVFMRAPPRYDPVVSDDLLQVLSRFHREVLLPEVKQSIQESEQRIRGEALSHFDALYQRLDRLGTDYHALAGAVGRLESACQRRTSPRRRSAARRQ